MMATSVLPVVRMRRGSDAYALHVTTYERGVAKSIVLYRLAMPWPASFPMIRMHAANETLPYMFVADENSLQLVARTLAMEIQIDIGVEHFMDTEDSQSTTEEEEEPADKDVILCEEVFEEVSDEASDEVSEEASEEASDEASEASALKIVFRLAKMAPGYAWADYMAEERLQEMSAWTFLWQYAAAVHDKDCLRELQTITLDGVRLILGGYQSLVIWSFE